jgi:hypothetical protein
VARHVRLDPLPVHDPEVVIAPRSADGAEKPDHDPMRVPPHGLTGPEPVAEGVPVRFQCLSDLVVQPSTDRGLVRPRLLQELPRVTILEECPDNLLGLGLVQALQHRALGIVPGFPVRNLAVSAAIEGRFAPRAHQLPTKQVQAPVTGRVVCDACARLFGDGVLATGLVRRIVPEPFGRSHHSSHSTAVLISIVDASIRILSLILSVAHLSRGRDGCSWKWTKDPHKTNAETSAGRQ